MFVIYLFFVPHKELSKLFFTSVRGNSDTILTSKNRKPNILLTLNVYTKVCVYERKQRKQCPEQRAFKQKHSSNTLVVVRHQVIKSFEEHGLNLRRQHRK